MSEIIVKEYDREKVIGWDQKDKKYLESNHFNNDSKSKRIELVDGTIRNNGPWVGIIKIDKDKEVHFCTKMGTNFFYMLSYLNDINSFHYDPSRLIELEQGKLFFDVIGKIMVEKFEQIRKKGLLKKYIVKEENVKFSKGKLLVKEQIKKNMFNKSRFYCRYDNLTFNNLENQSVLYATHLLTHFVKNSKLKMKLKRIENILSDEITLTKIIPEQLKNLRYNRLNSYYEDILKLSYHVIRKIYAQNVYSNKGIGFNFIVDMNKVYESFLTEMLKEIIDECYPELTLCSQETNKNLVLDNGGKKFTLKPDILIKKNNQVLFIIDVKYKFDKNVSNNDFYQMISYSLAYPEAKHRILLYEQIKNNDSTFSDVRKNDGETIRITFEEAGLNVLNGDYNNIEDFTNEIKKKLKRNLLDERILK